MIKSNKIKPYIIFSVILLITLLINCSWFGVKLKESISCDCIVQECCCDEDVINNSNCFKIYVDTHLFGGDREVKGMKKNIKKNIEHLNIMYPSFKERTFYLGDIVDLSNTKEEDRMRTISEIGNIRNSAGENYVRGNHEIDSFGKIGENRYTVYKGKILFLHGHTLRYFEDRANYWESGKKEEYKKGDWDKSRSLEEVFIEAAKEAEKYDCEIVVFGHIHPDDLDIRIINGIKIINVKKGCTYLSIPID